MLTFQEQLHSVFLLLTITSPFGLHHEISIEFLHTVFLAHTLAVQPRHPAT